MVNGVLAESLDQLALLHFARTHGIKTHALVIPPHFERVRGARVMVSL